MMSLEENKVIARKVTEAHDQGDITQLREALAPDFIWHIADIPQTLTREDYIQGVEMGWRAFSNVTLTIEDVIAQGDKVVIRSIVRGKHTGEFQQIAATGKEVEYEVVTIRRIAAGKVAEEWQISNVLTMFQQLGAYPPQA